MREWEELVVVEAAAGGRGSGGSGGGGGGPVSIDCTDDVASVA